MAGTAMVTFDLSKLAVAARKVAASVPSPLSYLKMEKSGSWVFGAEADEVPDNTQFAVNPEGFLRGYVAWQDTTSGAPAAKLGEVMFNVMEDLPDPGDVPKGSRGWEQQLGMQVKAINGKMEGAELRYSASSDGGRRAVSGLMTEVAEGMAANPGKIPLIVLENRSYKHASYGKIFVPVFRIVKWVPMPKAKAEKVKPAAVEQAPSRRRK